MARPLHLRSGNVVVLEGLDKTGKSTQIERLKATLSAESTDFAHMPSGITEFSRNVYQVLEDPDRRPRSGLAQQLAHLSCHSENIPALFEALLSKALVLDRCWWSTLVYGWYAGAVPATGMPEQTFRDLIAAVWAPITPAIVFVFLTPYEDDDNNNSAVVDGYRILLRQNPDRAVAVPPDSPERTEQFLLGELMRRGLVDEGKETR